MSPADYEAVILRFDMANTADVREGVVGALFALEASRVGPVGIDVDTPRPLEPVADGR